MTTSETPNMIYSTVHLDLTSKYIRLVEILPADDEAAPISCRFQIQTLDKPAPYTALSYTWGDPSNIKEISLDGEVFRVRDNLWQFLHEMRKQDRRDRFWIDAICIDQTNIQERNHQVALMKDIYTKAIRVAVWLGSASNKSELAINQIKYVAQKKSIWFPMWMEGEAEAIWALCNRDYWTRIWIVQEFMLAEELTLHCGSDSLPWHSLSFLFRLTLHLRLMPKVIDIKTKRYDMLRSGASTIIRQRIRIEDVRSSRPLVALGDRLGSQPLVALIKLYKHMHSTDVRDKLYGLLGLAKDTGLPEIHITADYGKSAADIYWDFLDQCWKHHGGLRGICGICGGFARTLHLTLMLPGNMAPKTKGNDLIHWTKHKRMVLLWPKTRRRRITPPAWPAIPHKGDSYIDI